MSPDAPLQMTAQDETSSRTTATSGRVVCIGGAGIDRKYRAHRPIEPGTSNPVASAHCFGGVARNVAENLARLGVSTSLVTLVGDDENGRAILRHLEGLGVSTRWCRISRHCGTAEYVAVLEPDGELAVGVADMAIFDGLLPERLGDLWPELPSATWTFADCNLPAPTLLELAARAYRRRFALAVDAVSTAKVMRLPHDLTGIDLLFLNLDEAKAVLAPEAVSFASPEAAASAIVGRGAARVVVTCGAAGLVAADAGGAEWLGPSAAEVVDVTGAGDALIAGTLAGLVRGCSLAQAAQFGMMAAALTIEHPASVRPDLSLAMIESRLPPSIS
jgi:pseudouridine kinase